MNNFTKILFGFLLISGFTSCDVIRLLQTDAPQDESSEQIDSYLDKNKFSSYDYSFRVSDSIINFLSTKKKHALSMSKFKKNNGASPIQLRIYKPDGSLQNGYEMCYGPFRRLNILDSYPTRIIPHLPTNYDLKFKDDIDLWNIDNPTKEKLLTESESNTYTFVLYWNMWSKYFSKVVLKEMEKYVEKYEKEGVNFLYILVNTGADPNT